MNTTDRTRFVEDLDLGAYEPRLRRSLLAQRQPAPAPNSNTSSGYVDDGSLISFVAGMPQQMQQDVLSSLLLAQLVANRAYDRERDTNVWYQQYCNVLAQVGWTGGLLLQGYQPDGVSFDMSSVVIAVLGAIASGDEIVAVTATLDALKSLPSNDGRLMLWNSAASTATAASFQIGTCVHSDGNVVMKIGAFHFTTAVSFTSVLWFKFPQSSIQIYQGTQTMVLSEQVYEGVRQAVIDKLGDRAQDFVAALPIG
jgi:hypothetical protein